MQKIEQAYDKRIISVTNVNITPTEPSWPSSYVFYVPLLVRYKYILL